MLLDLSKIRTPHVAFDEVYASERFPISDDQYRIAAPVQLHLDVTKTGERFRLTGLVQTVLELPCSRCLEAFLWPVEESFDLVYHPQSDTVGEGECEVEEDVHSTAFSEYEDAHVEAPNALRAEGGRVERVPTLPRTEASAPHLSELRILSRPPGTGRRRGVATTIVRGAPRTQHAALSSQHRAACTPS